MFWLDNNEKITKWGAECLQIPYQMTNFENGDIKIKSHVYHIDFFYEMRIDGALKQIAVEVKPKKDYEDVLLLKKGKFEIDKKLTLKKLKNLEYRFKTAQKNLEKWETMIKWCNKKGYEFIIITEDHLKKFNV